METKSEQDLVNLIKQKNEARKRLEEQLAKEDEMLKTLQNRLALSREKQSDSDSDDSDSDSSVDNSNVINSSQTQIKGINGNSSTKIRNTTGIQYGNGNPKMESSNPLMSSLSTSLQRAWPSDKNVIKTSVEQPSLSSLLRTASMISQNGGLSNPKHKNMIKELILSEDPGIRDALNSVSQDGGARLRHYLESKPHRVKQERKIETPEEEALRVIRERKKLEKSMKKAMKKAARVQKKLERLGTGMQGTTPPPPPMASQSQTQTTSPPTPGLNRQGSGALMPPPLPGSMSNQIKPRGNTSGHPFMNVPDGSHSPIGLPGMQLRQPSASNGIGNPILLNNLQSPMSPYGMFNPALTQLASQNAGNLLFNQSLQAGNSQPSAVAAATLLQTNTSLGESMGSRSKRDRPQSMNQLTSFREQNRTRHLAGMPPPLASRNSPNLPINVMNNMSKMLNHPVKHSANATNFNMALNKGSATPSASQPERAQQPPAQTPTFVTRPDIAVHTREYVRTGQPSAPPRRWTEEEDNLLRAAVKKHKERNWKAISKDVPGRNHVQCLQRWRKALDPTVVKGHWTTEEDTSLLLLVAENPKNWGHVARGIPGRTAKQCRERYHNHLDPSIKKGDWSSHEDTIIIDQQKKLGNKWAEISKFLPGRTENSVKIRWKSIQRQLQGGYNARRTRRPGPRFATNTNS
mmetsp:Transcript_11724/g.13484  ORF Transcript_11724/g.13484 Transcript_11724/m.13484 type:complete len:689 (-) Transcript_11724:843-2909(-)